MNQKRPISQAARMIPISLESLKAWIREGAPHDIALPKGKGRPSKMVVPQDIVEWAIANGKTGFTQKPQVGTQHKHELYEPPKDLPKEDPKPHGATPKKGMVASLDRMHNAEIRSYNDYVLAVREGNPMKIAMRQKLYVDCSKAMRDLEMAIDQRNALKEEIYIECSQAVQEWAEPIKALLDSFPRSVASRANPSSPQIAEEAIRIAIQNNLLPFMNSKLVKP